MNPLRSASNLETLVTLFKTQVDPFRNTRDLVTGTGFVTILQQEMQRITQKLDSVNKTETPVAPSIVAPPPPTLSLPPPTLPPPPPPPTNNNNNKDVNLTLDLGEWGHFQSRARRRKEKDKPKTSGRSEGKMPILLPPPIKENSLSALPTLVDNSVPEPSPSFGEDIILPPISPPPDPVEVNPVEEDEVAINEEHSPPRRRRTRRRHSAREPDATKTTNDKTSRPTANSAGPSKASKRHEMALIRYEGKTIRASTEQNAQTPQGSKEISPPHPNHGESPEPDRRSQRRRPYQAYASDCSSSDYYSGRYSPQSQNIESGSEGFGTFAGVLRHTPRNLKSEEVLLRKRTYHRNRHENVYVEYESGMRCMLIQKLL